MTFLIYHSKLKRIYFSFFNLHSDINSYLLFEIDQFKDHKRFFYKNDVFFFEIDSKLKLKIKKFVKYTLIFSIIYTYADFFKFSFKFIATFFT